MKLDRTKHNKFATGAIYGNTTSGGMTPSSSAVGAVGDGGSTVIIQSGSSAYNKLNNEYFSKLFVAIDANGNEINPNDSTTEIASIKAKYGFWTEHFISVKGTVDESDTTPAPYSKLSLLTDVAITQPVENGQTLVYRDGYWVNEIAQTEESKFGESFSKEMEKWFAIDETTGAIYPVDNRGFFSNSFISALGLNGTPGSGGSGGSGSSVLEDDILVTTTVGYYSNGNTIAKGTSWEEIFRKMLYKATPATLSGKISTSTDLEIGSTKGILTYTTYRNDSGAMTDAYYDGNTENKLSFSAEDSSGKQTVTRELTGQHTARETYKATVVFAANEELEVPQQTLTSTISVNVYRKWFAGIVDVVPTTSAEVRSLASGGLYKGAGTYSFNVEKWKNFVICIPSGDITSLTLTAYPGNFIEDTKTCNYIGTIMVEGANGYTASEYKMWQIKTAGENDADKFTFKTNG